MKKLIYQFLLFSGIVGTLFMTSCNNDDSEEPVPGPTITVTLTSGQTISDDTVRAQSGGNLSFDVDATAPAGFNTLRVTDGVTGNILFETNRNELGIDAGVSVVPTIPVDGITLPTTEVTVISSLQFSVVDENSNTADETFTIEVQGEPSIEEYQAVLLGGQLNSTDGSFYNSLDNEVYFLSEAGTNDDKVDLLFYYVTSPGLNYMIASPDNDEAQTTFNTDPDDGGPLTAPGWPLTTENATRFKPLDVTFDYSSATTSSDLANAYPEVGAEQERMLDLQEGEVFAFQTSPERGDRYGIIEVVSIDGTSGSNRSITINVKVQSVDN